MRGGADRQQNGDADTIGRTNWLSVYAKVPGNDTVISTIILPGSRILPVELRRTELRQLAESTLTVSGGIDNEPCRAIVRQPYRRETESMDFDSGSFKFELSGLLDDR
jgi:hypothetical protein